jgi:hypothetical protein
MKLLVVLALIVLANCEPSKPQSVFPNGVANWYITDSSSGVEKLIATSYVNIKNKKARIHSNPKPNTGFEKVEIYNEAEGKLYSLFKTSDETKDGKDRATCEFWNMDETNPGIFRFGENQDKLLKDAKYLGVRYYHGSLVHAWGSVNYLKTNRVLYEDYWTRDPVYLAPESGLYPIRYEVIHHQVPDDAAFSLGDDVKSTCTQGQGTRN